MASSAKDKAKSSSKGRGATERRRVTDRILHNNAHLPELLLDSLPYPAMLIQKDRTILAANHIAKQLGAKAGGHCWSDFGQSDFIPDEDRKYINDHKKVPPGGTHCTFCMADEALENQTPQNKPEIEAWGKVWDTHWIPLDKETYLNYAIDVTHIVREDEKLRMSEIKHRTLAQNIPGLVYRMLAKQDNRMLFFNDMLKSMTGFKESELNADEVCSIEPHILSEDRDMVAAMVKHACDEKEPFEVEYHFECKNGDIKWFKEIGRPTFGPDDELLFIDGIITDITERKQAEEQLRSSEEKYRVLFEGLAEPVTIVDREGIVLMVNAAGARNIGLSQEESVGKSIFEVLPGIDDSLHEVYQQVIDTGISVTREDFLEFPSGHRWFWSIHQPVSDVNGTRYGVQIISYDITERKQAEEALRDREEKWRSLAETAPVAIMNVSRDGTIKFINHVLEQHTLEQVIGTRVYDYLSQDQHDRVRKSLERVFETGKPDSLEILAVGPEGPETAWYENHIGPILDQNGKVSNVTMVAIDITERKRAENQLHNESAFREAVIERAAEGICVCHAVEEHPYVEFTVWNERMQEITGYTMEEINRLGWYQTVYPDSEVRERAIERMEHLRHGDDLVAEEWEITRKDGLKRLMAISTSVITTEGNKIHVLALMHDITQEKKLQVERESLLKSRIAKSQ